uniref:Ig-like domain-containing protein n=1 Tax=Canis lupus dingo TaxID=286419 RepID=A0A8C0K4X7_CANLU
RQGPYQITVLEGTSVTMNCIYTFTQYPTLFWYVQYPNKALQLLHKETMENSKNFGARNIKDKNSPITKSSVQVSNSAMYYCIHCGANTGGSSYGKLTFGQGTFLTVHPNVQDPDPSVYQMRSPKTGRTVCLFTDFDSQADFQKPEGATVISLNSTVLDMKVMDSKSNGALTWNSETNIEFSTLNFKKIVFVSLFLLLDYSCDAKLIEKSFETDMDLNFYNLLVIGLRILLLKVIGFNLFMTLRLWSC